MSNKIYSGPTDVVGNIFGSEGSEIIGKDTYTLTHTFNQAQSIWTRDRYGMRKNDIVSSSPFYRFCTYI